MAGDKTIDGRGARVEIAYGAGITIQFVNNVIIHGIRIHDIKPKNGGLIRDSVDHFGFRTGSDGDGISIFGSQNVWIDHVSMTNCADGLIDVIQGSTGVTISNSHFTDHNDVTIYIYTLCFFILFIHLVSLLLIMCVAGDAFRRIRQLHTGHENASDGSVQPFRKEIDTKNAESQIWLHPCC